MRTRKLQAARRRVFEHFLLNTLEEDARVVLRARLITDPNTLAEMREVEFDLLDAIACDTLEVRRRRLATDRLLTGSPHRSAWLVSRALAERTRRERGPSASAAPRAVLSGVSSWLTRVWRRR
jgi:hypothetical protein